MLANDFQSLFITALLSLRTDLDDQQRALIVSSIPEMGAYDREEVRAALNKAVKGEDGKPGSTPVPPSWPTARQMEKALSQARDWKERGVFILSAEQLNLPEKILKTSPPLFFAYGRRRVLNKPLAAVLNSRKPRRISPQDRWILTTKSLFKLVEKDGYGVATSLGSYAYDLVCCLAKTAGLPTLIVCDGPLPFMFPREKTERFLEKYDRIFPAEKTLFISPFTPGRMSAIKERALRRDACLVNLASFIMGVEIRSKGNMVRLIKESLKQGKTVKVFRPEKFDRARAGNRVLLDSGAQPYRPRPGFSLPKAENKRRRIPGARKIQIGFNSTSYLVHFTRSCPGPWPGETLYEFYRSVLNGDEGAAHTAFDTLIRILKEHTIRGSGHLIRGQIPVVSFTDQDLKKLSNLIRWRQGLIRWSFEPYGIAVAKDVLVQSGAKPVIYSDEDGWDRLADDQKYRFQLNQPPDTDWSAEKEWRLPADLHLDAVPKKYIRILLPSIREAKQIASAFDYRVVLLTGFEK